MAKPRILILMHYMELGGAEISLVGLLGALDPARVDVDLFIHSHQGPLMKFIPQWINLLPEKKAYSMIERPMTEAARRGAWGVVAGRLLAKLKHRRYIKANPPTGDDATEFQFVGDCVTPFLPDINPEVEYDLCISFLTPHNIGRDKVRARKRIAWIHTDYSTVSVNASQELPVWNAYDHIASISPDVTRSFTKTFPSLAPKIIEIENILSPAFVRSRAEEADVSAEMPSNLGGGVNILSIGRYAFQKNFDNIPAICKELMNLLSIGRYCTAKNYDNVPDITRRIIDAGITDLKWYIIGYGDDTLIRERIRQAGMEEHVIMLGKKENPYPYIKACDIYVQPSRYEGKSVTVREAQMLCKPVAVTAYPTASSQINDGVDGVIVPMDNEGCAQGLARFILDTGLQQRITDHLRHSDFGNEKEVEKIYTLL